MSENATIVITAVPNPEGVEDMKEYIKKVRPVLSAGGGEILSSVKVDDVVFGDPEYEMLMVMSFPSADAARATFGSGDYLALKPLREKGFKRVDATLVENAG